MGHNAKIILPDAVRVNDAATVMAIASGHKPSLEPLGRNGIHCKVGGVQVTHTSEPILVRIMIDSTTSHDIYPGFESHMVCWHFESEYAGRLMLPRSTPYWLAIGFTLVNFFGGKLIYDDHNTAEYYEHDLGSLNTRDYISPSDGQAWDDFQRRLAAVPRLTKGNIDAWVPHAVYSDE